jgi:G3E family GTPase
VLVCADVESIRDLADDRWVADTVRDQLRGADAVLLTNTDRVTAERGASVGRWVAKIAPGASIVADRGRVPDLLLTGSGLSTGAGRAAGHGAGDSASRAPHDRVHTGSSSGCGHRGPPTNSPPVIA